LLAVVVLVTPVQELVVAVQVLGVLEQHRVV